MFSRRFDRHRKNKTTHRDSISVWYVFLSIVHSFARISCDIYFCRIYRISFLYAIQYTQIDIRISPIRLDFRLRFAICSVRRENPIISTGVEKKMITKKHSESLSSYICSSFKFGYSYGFIFAACKRDRANWRSHHPRHCSTTRKSSEWILAYRDRALFSGKPRPG